MTKPTLSALPALVTLTAAALCHATAARADDLPSNTLRVGMYAVFYHVKADDISGPYVPAGVNLDVNNTQTAYFAYIRRLSSGFDFEFTFGIPPNTKTVGKGPATLGSVPYNGVIISTARWAAPSALLEYKFFSENAAFRPYLGVGVNYTSFYDRQATAAGEAGSGGPTRISLTSSVGPVGTVGLKYQPGTRWSVIASYSITRVDTSLKADTAGAIRTTHISFGPQALVVAAGYSF
ncbi:MAG: OmpW/AlkL family protein [Steroidobacteraceae bacterium]